MFFKTLFIFVPVVSLAVLSGCKATCTGVCDSAKDADCATTATQTINGMEVPKSTFDHVQCIAGCQRQQDMEDDGVNDCKTEFDTLVDCANSQADICNVWQIEDINTDTGAFKMKKCNSQTEDYQSCLSDYCVDHTKRDYCN
jgi:hypothetical protein